MTYQVLARKWRPQNFSSLIGQEPVVQALRNALAERRIAQAYLFSGIRGVGKTTAARVLAKALNCERGPAADPCNDCTVCEEVTRGADLDVLEIDAATYSKVEQVRDLTESLKYGPARDRYKVVVLDEVHRLSRQAFDALLKIIEEPPPYLVFIFATTEIEAVPATVLSRCQEFHFRRVAVGELAAHLAEIAVAEQISASPAALRLVARAGDGSVRDAVALLDQLATYGSGTIADDDAARLIGGFDPELFHRLLEAIVGGDGAAVSAAVAETEAEGRDPRQLFSRFLTYGRDALRLALGGSAEQIELPEDEVRRLGELVACTGYENLLRLVNLLLSCEQLVRRSELAHLALEIALLRAAELPKLTRVEALLAAGGGPADAGPAASGPSSERSSGVGRSPGRKAAPAPEPAPERPPEPSSTPPPEAPDRQPAREPEARDAGETVAATPDPRPPGPARSKAEAPVAATAEAAPASPAAAPIDTLLGLVRRRRQALAAHLEAAQGLAFDGGALVITRARDNEWLDKALERSGNRRVLEEALEQVPGATGDWRAVDAEGAGGAAAQPGDEAVGDVAADPQVQAVLEIFNGTIQGVGPLRGAGQEER